MDFVDYREALGLSFFDTDKFEEFETRIFNYLDTLTTNGFSINFNDYFSFCIQSGSKINPYYKDLFKGQERFKHCVQIINNHRKNLQEFLLYYVWFVNSLNFTDNYPYTKEDFIIFLKNALNLSHISYEIIEDNNKIYVFPKGAQELDYALVSEPLKWLAQYPLARKTFVIALTQYSEGIYIRDVADNLRKALETFLQEFLRNSKNLESNKTEICKYLGSLNIDAGISGLFQPLINAYKNINDRIAKHNDAVDKQLLEFLLYQTGVLIRMVIVAKNNEIQEMS